MTPIETILTLSQLASIFQRQQDFSKYIDHEMNICYNTCAFEEEALSGSLKTLPAAICKLHSSSFNKE